MYTRQLYGEHAQLSDDVYVRSCWESYVVQQRAPHVFWRNDIHSNLLYGGSAPDPFKFIDNAAHLSIRGSEYEPYERAMHSILPQ